jgi:hypothetical protein
MKKDNRVSDVQSDSVNEAEIGSVRKSEVDKVRDRLIHLAHELCQPNSDLMPCRVQMLTSCMCRFRASSSRNFSTTVKSRRQKLHRGEFSPALSRAAVPTTELCPHPRVSSQALLPSGCKAAWLKAAVDAAVNSCSPSQQRYPKICPVDSHLLFTSALKSLLPCTAPLSLPSCLRPPPLRVTWRQCRVIGKIEVQAQKSRQESCERSHSSCRHSDRVIRDFSSRQRTRCAVALRVYIFLSFVEKNCFSDAPSDPSSPPASLIL